MVCLYCVLFYLIVVQRTTCVELRELQSSEITKASIIFMVFLSVLYKFCDGEYKCVCRVRLLLCYMNVMGISIVRALSLTY
jgi:hypothetical protein